MAHWAELDENNIVLRVIITDNDDPNGDEGYQWLLDNLGGRWLQTSYNTQNGVHLLGKTPVRYTYAGIGYRYDEKLDAFIQPSPLNGFIFNEETMQWEPPYPQPDSGFWYWNEEIADWDEREFKP